jgi:hypothetical protein
MTKQLEDYLEKLQKERSDERTRKILKVIAFTLALLLGMLLLSAITYLC